MKTCKKCLQEKELDRFYKNPAYKDGHFSSCIDCENAAYYIRNKEKRRLNKIIKKEYLLKNPKPKKKYISKQCHYSEHTEEIKMVLRQKALDYYYKNKEKVLTKNKQYLKLKRKDDPLFILKDNLRKRIRRAVKKKGLNYENFAGIELILGCDIMTLKGKFEKMFADGMSWDNHGEWHIDHIKPLATGKTVEEVLLLNHHSNLQPLWAKDNLFKGKKYI